MAKGKYEKWLEPDGLLLLEGWARDGLTDEQIAHNCGIRASTLYDWKNRFAEIEEALKKGKAVVDYEVENALLKRAKGYNYTEITQEPLFNPITGEAIRGQDGKQIIATVKIVAKHVPPDVTACAIWLNNRRPEQFRRNAGKEKLDDKKFEHEQEIDRKRYW